MTVARTRSTTREAGCHVCHTAAHWTGANAQAVAARHHDQTGHPTWCIVAVSYGQHATDARQIDIEDAIASALRKI